MLVDRGPYLRFALLLVPQSLRAQISLPGLPLPPGFEPCDLINRVPVTTGIPIPGAGAVVELNTVKRDKRNHEIRLKLGKI